MTEPLPFAAALRAELLAAATRRLAARRRRARRLAMARTAAIGIVLVVAASTAVRPDVGDIAGADVVIDIGRDEVIVTLDDIEHRPDRIEAAVRAAGLDVSIDAVPVGPSRVGRFLGRETAGSLPPELRWLDGFYGFALPVGWPGSLRLLVGAPADGDEPYAVFSDALLPGEPLACRDLVGRRAGDVTAELARTGLDLRYEGLDGTRTSPLSAADVRTGPHADWTVSAVEATSRHAVVIRLRPFGASRVPPAAGCSG